MLTLLCVRKKTRNFVKNSICSNKSDMFILVTPWTSTRQEGSTKTVVHILGPKLSSVALDLVYPNNQVVYRHLWVLLHPHPSLERFETYSSPKSQPRTLLILKLYTFNFLTPPVTSTSCSITDSHL